MPVTNSFRIPTSVNRGGNTLTNLRGIVEGTKSYDYATGLLTPTTTDILQVTSAFETNSGEWTSTIRYAYEPIAQNNQASVVSYPSIVASTMTATVLFRTLIKTFDTNGCVFLNGNTSFPYSGFYVLYTSFCNNFEFYVEDGLNNNFFSFPLNSSPVALNTWYHYGVKISVDENLSTVVTVWEDGVKKNPVVLNFTMLAPTGVTHLLNDSNNTAPLYGKITDFVLLNGTSLTDSQMSAFATAPFV